MKNLIIQIYCSLDNFSEANRIPKHDEIKELSTSLVKLYADRCEADYILFDTPVINFRHPTYERFRLWEESYWCDTYDQVLYLDTDIFIWPETPNIFEEYPGKEFKIAEHWNKEKKFRSLDKEFLNSDITTGDFVGYKHKDLFEISFNAGMFIITKESRDIMLPYLNYRDSLNTSDDSKILHRLLLDSKVPYLYLPRQWNAKNMTRGNSYFSHLWGTKKISDPNMQPILNAREILDVENTEQ